MCRPSEAEPRLFFVTTRAGDWMFPLPSPSKKIGYMHEDIVNMAFIAGFFDVGTSMEPCQKGHKHRALIVEVFLTGHEKLPF